MIRQLAAPENIRKAMRYILLSCCLGIILFLFSCFYKNDTITHIHEEQCYYVPPDKMLDSVRNSLKLKQQYLDEYFSALHHSGVFNGNVLIAEKGKIVYIGSFGKIGNNAGANPDIERPFQLASVSKIFTAVAILQLYEKKLLGLDDEVQKYLPQFPYQHITIRHLLAHRSGLPRYEAFNQQQWDWTQPMTNADMLSLFIKYKPPLQFKPGRLHDYCNTNFAMLALVIEAVSQKKFKDYMKENIFVPAGMEHAFVFDIFNPPSADSIALGHARGYRLPLEPQHDYLNGVNGDKGIYASVIDLFKFDVALYNGTLLKPETLHMAFQPTIRSRRNITEDYGLGHRLKDWRQNGQFIPYHSGWWRGFKTLFIRDIYQHKTIIMLCNQDISPQATLIWNTLNF